MTELKTEGQEAEVETTTTEEAAPETAAALSENDAQEQPTEAEPKVEPVAPEAAPGVLPEGLTDLAGLLVQRSSVDGSFLVSFDDGRERQSAHNVSQVYVIVQNYLAEKLA